MPAHQGFHSSHKAGIQHCIVMIVAVTEAMERAPEHSLRLIEAAAPRDQALLDLGDCQVCTVLRIPTFPRDETEALLAAQMAAIHKATMVAARRWSQVETIPQQDSASNMLNKLAPTFVAQVEALKKYRSAGEQTIKVQHVTVKEGCQAIVGSVNQGVGTQQIMETNLMNPVQRLNAAPRCSATSKRSRHQRRAPAVRGWKVCRFHGARGGAPKGKANGAWQHGRFTDEATTILRQCTALMRRARTTIGKL